MTTKPDRRRRAAPSAATRGRRAGTAIARLVQVMDVLRSPDGCPWDRKQTHRTLRAHLVEETYEVLDAIDRGQLDKLPEELGDVLFQCVFHAQIAAEAGRFDLAGAIDTIVEKLIRRHPHVFTTTGRKLPRADRRRSRIRTPKAVKEQWEQIKAREKAGSGMPARVLSGVPRALPALLRAHEIGRRVAAVGFEWAQSQDVLDKIEEEVRELREAVTAGSPQATEEFGDLLFSIAQLARKLAIEPESALRAANEKFTTRFDALEGGFESRGQSVHGSSLAEMEAEWGRVKHAERSRISRGER